MPSIHRYPLGRRNFPSRAVPAQGGVVVILDVLRVQGAAERQRRRRVEAGTLRRRRRRRRGLVAVCMHAGVLTAVAAVETARGHVGPLVTNTVA